MKKGLLIGLIIVAIVATPFIFVRLAFGPLRDSITIDLRTEGELICNEIYNADFAEEFYDVKMILETTNGKKWDLGSVTFHNQDWNKLIKTIRVGDWLVIPLEPGNLVQIKMVNTLNGQLNDTTLLPFNDGLNNLYPGTSKIIDISGDRIEVNYEYKAKAEYPSEILVNQRVVYQVDPTEGILQAKEIFDRVAE